MLSVFPCFSPFSHSHTLDTDDCQVLNSCSSCTASPALNCGYCVTNNKCNVGSVSGPLMPSLCPASNTTITWDWTWDQCAGALNPPINNTAKPNTGSGNYVSTIVMTPAGTGTYTYSCGTPPPLRFDTRVLIFCLFV